MSVFFGFLTVVCLGCLIAGLVKPELVIKEKGGFKTKKQFVLSMCAAVVICAIIAGASSDGSSTASETSGSSEKAAAPETVIKVGDPIKEDNLQITVLSVDQKSTVGGQYFNKKASEGGTFIAVRFSVKNISDKPVSTLFGTKVKLVDANGTKYDQDIEASGYYNTEVNPDTKTLSDLNPGITVKDGAVFEISKESWQKKGWSVLVEGDKEHIVSIK